MNAGGSGGIGEVQMGLCRCLLFLSFFSFFSFVFLGPAAGVSVRERWVMDKKPFEFGDDRSRDW